MASVDAHADPGLVLDTVDDHLELPEVSADGVALPRHVLQDHLDPLGLADPVIDRLGDQLDALLHADLATGRSYAAGRDQSHVNFF